MGEGRIVLVLLIVLVLHGFVYRLGGIGRENENENEWDFSSPVR